MNRRVAAERIVDRVRHTLNRGVQVQIVMEELESYETEMIKLVAETMREVADDMLN
jgi:hypothetical protein